MASPNPQNIDIPIVGDSENIPQDDPEWTLNMYAEKISEDILTLKPTPGTVLNSQTAQNGGNRGQITIEGRYFVVTGSVFLEKVGTSYVTYPNAVLLSNSGEVAMIANNPPGVNAQILIVDDSHGYVFDLAANTWVDSVTMTANGFVGGLSQAAFCAGRGIAIKPGTAQWQFSKLYDFTIWNDPNDSGFATCLSLLDGALRAVVSNGDLAYFFSETGFEVWQNVGSSPNPLQRVLAYDKIGILAPYSALFSERYVYWLGGTIEGQGVVYRHTGGGMPERISTHSIEREIAALSNQADANGAVMFSVGHVFYLLTFRQAQKTLCYDARTGLWHERAQRLASTGQLLGLPFVSIIIFGGKFLGIDYRDDKVWEISNTIFTDAGNPIPRSRKLFPIPKEGDYLTYYQSAELFGEVGNTPADQPDPLMEFRYSVDRGKTWSLPDSRPIGGYGSGYETRVKFTGIGAGYSISLWFYIIASQYISWRMVRLRAQ